MSNFALLWNKMLLSSLWINGSKETKLLFVTMLMLKDADGIVLGSLVGLAAMARLTPEECKAALSELLGPDPDDTSGVLQGRRLEEINGGWRIVNHDLYRFSTEARREFWRQQKAEQRAKVEAKPKKRSKKYGPTERERHFEKAHGDGDAAKADAFH